MVFGVDVGSLILEKPFHFWSVIEEDGVVQGIRHREHPVTGVQFHPESVMTTEGMALLKNYLA